MPRLFLGICLSNLKSVALTVLELLAYVAQNFGRDHGRSPFQKMLRGHVRTVPGNMLFKFEIRSFNHFGAISI